jgi:dynein heavy chain
VLYEESLNTVLLQESIRYNRLLKIIETSLKDLLKAIKGLVVMSEALDKMATSLFSNIVPALWASKAYPSLKPLGIGKYGKANLSIRRFQELGCPI